MSSISPQPSQDLKGVLRAKFGLTALRPGQEEAILPLLTVRDSLAVLPTGGGKSLIYQLAALCLPGTTLVISPLKALMKDQVDALCRLGIASTFVNSALPSREQRERLSWAAEGNCKLLYVAPERLLNRGFRESIRGTNISLLAVDEAHCVSMWGKDFRPDYLRIAPLRTDLGSPPLVALTATATPEVRAEIVRLLDLQDPALIVKGFNRPNLELDVRHVETCWEKQELLLASLRGDPGPSIVYVGTREAAEEQARYLGKQLRRPVGSYHAGMNDRDRELIQDQFMSGRLDIVCATNAFGMGIDRADVRLVVHFDIPGSVEAYYQEAGRAGRDGLPARALLIYCPSDDSLQTHFISKSGATVEDLRLILRCLQEHRAASEEEVRDATGFSETKIRVAVARMEQEALLRRSDVNARGFEYVVARGGGTEELQRIAELFLIQQAKRREDYSKIKGYVACLTCRRRYVLDHFGDDEAPEADPCCDRCRTILDLKTPLDGLERAALLVLDLVQRGAFVSVDHLTGELKTHSQLAAAGKGFARYAVIQPGTEEELVQLLFRLAHIRLDKKDRRLVLTVSGLALSKGGLD